MPPCPPPPTTTSRTAPSTTPSPPCCSSGTATGSSPTTPAISPWHSARPAPGASRSPRRPRLSTERGENHGYDELQGEGWTRLLTAARRRLERTGGALDGDIGLTRPSDAERRTVIG